MKALIVLLVIILSIFGYITYKEGVVKEELRKVAGEITDACNKEGVCPVLFKGFTEIRECRFRSTNYSVLLTYIPMSNGKCDKDNPNSFDLFYNPGPGAYIVASGGVGIDVTIKDYFDDG